MPMSGAARSGRTRCCRRSIRSSSAIPSASAASYLAAKSPAAVSIAGLTEGIGYRLGACCHPIPGDRIIGLMVPGEGCVIHTVDCEVLDRHQDSMADWIDVRWKDHGGALSVARIAGAGEEHAGALAALANVIGQNGGQHLQPEDHQPQSALFRIPGRRRGARRGPSGKSHPRAEGGSGGRRRSSACAGLDTDDRGRHRTRRSAAPWNCQAC